MEAGALSDLASKLSREQFVGRFRSLFLVVKQEADDVAIGFTTAVVDFADGREHREPAQLEWEVYPVAKAAGNPYPDRISVGRARNCDLVMRDPSVSKLHAHFRVRPGGGYDLVDLDSPNGTRLNGQTLRPHEPAPIKPGDEVHFGTLATRVVDAGRLYDLFQFG